MKKKVIFLLSIVLFLPPFFFAVDLFNNSNKLYLGRLKYDSGGDWYSNPSSLPNLLAFFRKKTGMDIAEKELVVSLKDNSYKKVAVIYFTGHGGFSLDDSEKENLRQFISMGGFVFADDNYGMDQDIRRELNSLYQDIRLKKIPSNHKIFRYPFPMPRGLPKIHRHDGGLPVAYGLFIDGILKVIYTYNTDLGDGWEDPDIHRDGSEKHRKALEMGANILFYAFHYALEY